MSPKSNGLSFWIISVASCFLAGCEDTGSGVAVQNRADGKTVGTVQLEIDFNSQRRKISVDVPCSSDSTVFSILQRAQNIGDLKFDSTGTGERVFVSSIGGVENQAAGDNWVYQVNGKLGDRSSGVYAVKPGDHVSWVFGDYP